MTQNVGVRVKQQLEVNKYNMSYIRNMLYSESDNVEVEYSCGIYQKS